MRKSLLFLLSIILIAPAVAKAANAQAQEYDELGLALYRQGLYAKAIPYFQNAVQADPADWQGYEDLGNSYFKINDNADALSAYQKSLQINPDNTTLENIVQSLRSSGVAANPTAPANTTNPPANNGYAAANQPPANNTYTAANQPPAGTVPPAGGVENEQPIGSNQPPAAAPPSQPGTTTVVVEHRRRWSKPAPVNYADGLAPINHAKVWLDADLAYNWSNLPNLFSGAANENAYIKTNGFTGIATADHSGIEGGAELGFLLDANNGIAIGVRGIVSNPYTSNINYQNGGDFETINIQPYVVPLTLDYYLFLPDHDGRFFITAGVGYYFADVNVNDNYSYYNGGGPTDQIVGNLTGGTIGFQLGIGREFEIGRHLGLRIFGRGRYAKITNISGNLTSNGGVTDNYGLVNTGGNYLGNSIAVDSTSNIGSNGEGYATLDYTGFDIGVGLTFF